MSLNIIDLIKGQLGPSLVSQAATQYGESESGISKAISGLIPAVVGGLANNADKPGVLDAITNAGSGSVLNNLLGASNNSIVTTLLNHIFGDKISALVNAISGYAGVSNTTSHNLLNTVTGAAVGTLGKYSTDNNLGTSGLTKLLNDQRGLVSSLLPAGLSLATLGLGHFGGNDHASTAAHTTSEKVNVTSHTAPKVEVNRTGNTHVDVEKKDDNSFWKWLLPLLLLLAAGYFLWRNCDKKPEPTTDSTAVVTDSTTSSAPVTGDSTTAVAGAANRVDQDIDLNGTPIKGYKGGMEDRMIAFLKADSYKNAADDAALKDNWYDFDKVNFKMNSSTQLEAGSEMQLQNLVAILKAFPDAKIKIGGYTDKTGQEPGNLKLSGERANFIKKYLTDKGVGTQVIGAEGYGSKYATVAATASDAERAKDRKMAVRFAK